MRVLKLSVLVLFAFLALLACSGNKGARKSDFVIAESKSVEASIFKAQCALCHGNEANGKEVSGVQVPSLRYGKAANLTEAQIYEQIKFGRLPMPSFKDQLSDEDIRKMVKFIMRDLQGRE